VPAVTSLSEEEVIELTELQNYTLFPHCCGKAGHALPLAARPVIDYVYAKRRRHTS